MWLNMITCTVFSDTNHFPKIGLDALLGSLCKIKFAKSKMMLLQSPLCFFEQMWLYTNSNSDLAVCLPSR